MEQKERLKEIALIFFKLGTTAFGGPAAHVATMDDEIVKKRKWLSGYDRKRKQKEADKKGGNAVKLCSLSVSACRRND